MSDLLSTRDWSGAAWMLDCEEATIQAVAEVEAPRGGYLRDGQVSILFERHIFHRRTGGKFDRSHPGVSNPHPGGYKGGTREHERLQEAVELDRDAALQSASWGRFQIMAYHWQRCGYESLQSFVNGMIQGGEPEHLRAFCCFIRSDSKLQRALRGNDFPTVASIYNGRNYRINRWDIKMAQAYERLSQEGVPA